MKNTETLALANAAPALRRRIGKTLKHYRLTDAGDPRKQRLGEADLVIVDMQLPATNAIEILKAVRDQNPRMPVLMLTGDGMEGRVVSEALEFGGVDYLRKPFDPEDLYIRVSHLLRQPSNEIVTATGSSLAADGMKVENARASAQEIVTEIEVPMPELHGSSGRLDAYKIAEYLKIPLRKLSEAIGVNYSTVHKTPDAASLQRPLAEIKHILAVLRRMLGKHDIVLAWLNSPHPSLGDRTPISVILEGHYDVVTTMIDNAMAGVPT